MITILIAGEKLASQEPFKSALRATNARIVCLDSGRKALAEAAKENFDLMVTDEDLGDMSGLEAIKSIVTQQPMLNCAAVSALAPDAFHEISEGLGILMQLPPDPGPQEATLLLEHLYRIQSYAFKLGHQEV